MLMPTSRRTVLRFIALIIGAAFFVPVAGRSVLAAENAVQLENLSAEEGLSLLKLAQALFPHSGISEDAYWQVILRLDRMAAEPGFQGLISAGLAELDELSGGSWKNLSAEAKTARLEQIETGAFFQTMRILTLIGLYGNPEVAMRLGYEGGSFEFGGYLNRGFDDLDWLPDPAG